MKEENILIKDSTGKTLMDCTSNTTIFSGICGKCHKYLPNTSLDKNSTCFECAKPEFRLEGKALDYDWKDIDDEKWRVYVFPGGDEVEIVAPLKIHVSESGGHRIFDAEGFCHYIPSGWIHIAWLAKKEQAHFRF